MMPVSSLSVKASFVMSPPSTTSTMGRPKAGEVPVALVVAGNAHDDARAVAHQDVVGNKHRHDLAGGGVDDLDAVETNAGLFLVELAALKVALARAAADTPRPRPSF